MVSNAFFFSLSVDWNSHQIFFFYILRDKSFPLPLVPFTVKQHSEVLLYPDLNPDTLTCTFSLKLLFEKIKSHINHLIATKCSGAMTCPCHHRPLIFSPPAFIYFYWHNYLFIHPKPKPMVLRPVNKRAVNIIISIYLRNLFIKVEVPNDQDIIELVAKVFTHN